MPGVIAHVSEELRAGRPIRTVPDEQVDYGDRRSRLRRRPAAAAGWAGPRRGVRLSGRSVAVTGAGSGIGAAIAAAFAAAGRPRARRRHLGSARLAEAGRAHRRRLTVRGPRARRHRLGAVEAFVAAADDDPTATALGGVRQLRRRVRRLRRHRRDVARAVAADHRRQPDGLLPRLQGRRAGDGRAGRRADHQHRVGGRAPRRRRRAGLRRVEGRDRGHDPAAGHRPRPATASPPTSSRPA